MRPGGWAGAIAKAAFAAGLLAQAPAVHAPDGGTQQFVQSVDIPTLPNAPFSGIVRTEWTHILPDSTRGTVYNHRLVARDSSGRVFQERRFFDPHGDAADTRLSQLQYDDPNRHERVLCFPQRSMCEVSRLPAPAATVQLQPVGPLPGGNATLEREDLGRKSLQGLDAVGTREVTTYKAGVFGNAAPEPVVKEFWYAPHLGVNLVTKRFDPRVSSAQNFLITDINLTEPDPKLFQPPANYQMVRTER